MSLKMEIRLFFRKNFRIRSFFLQLLLIMISLILTHYFATSGQFHVFEYLVYLGIFGAGLWFIRATLLFFVSESVASWTLILIVFGSNLFTLPEQNISFSQFCFSLYTQVSFILQHPLHDHAGFQKRSTWQ